MRYHCRCLIIHAPTNQRLDEQDADEIGLRARVVFGVAPAQQAQ